jgi:hypothetical protein
VLPELSTINETSHQFRLAWGFVIEESGPRVARLGVVYVIAAIGSEGSAARFFGMPEEPLNHKLLP